MAESCLVGGGDLGSLSASSTTKNVGNCSSFDG